MVSQFGILKSSTELCIEVLHIPNEKNNEALLSWFRTEELVTLAPHTYSMNTPASNDFVIRFVSHSITVSNTSAWHLIHCPMPKDFHTQNLEGFDRV